MTLTLTPPTHSIRPDRGKSVAGIKRVRRFTVHEFTQMYEHGIFKPGERVELLNGEIFNMNPVGGEHSWCVTNLHDLIFKSLSNDLRMQVQSPLRLSDDSQPEQDLMIVKKGPDRETRLPKPEDVLLVIEVSDTSLQKDRSIKAQIYAEAGIAETWIIDLKGKTIEVLTEPGAKGYRSAKKFRKTTKVSPRLLPGISLALSEVLK